MLTKRFILIYLLSLTSCYNPMQALEDARLQTIVVETPMAENSFCKLTDARGNKWNVLTPNTVTIRKGYDPLAIICKKAGYKTYVGQIFTKQYNEDQDLLTLSETFTGVYYTPYGTLFQNYRYMHKIFLEPNVWPSEEFKKEWQEAKMAWENELFKLKAEDIDKQKQMEENARKTNSIIRIRSLHPYGVRQEDENIEKEFDEFQDNEPYKLEDEIEQKFDDFKLFLFGE